MNTVDTKHFKGLLKFLEQVTSDGINERTEKAILNMLDYAVPFFSNLVIIDEFPEIHRMTINKRVLGKNKRIRDIGFLKYPPSEKVTRYGRCNYPKQSVLYASIMKFTTINESQPKVGDLITDSIWRNRGNQTLKYSPIFKNQPLKENSINPRTFNINNLYEKKIKIYPEEVQEQINVLMQFVTDAFTKTVDPSNDLDYLVSAYFANKIFHDFEDGTIEAIYYPSVKEKLSFENLAIKPTVFDAKYELVEVKESVCVMDTSNGRGGYFFQGLNDCTSFNYSSNKILWDENKLMQSKEVLSELQSKYEIDLS